MDSVSASLILCRFGLYPLASGCFHCHPLGQVQSSGSVACHPTLVRLAMTAAIGPLTALQRILPRLRSGTTSRLAVCQHSLRVLRKLGLSCQIPSHHLTDKVVAVLGGGRLLGQG